MSYDISLCDPVTGEIIELEEPHHMRGGTFAVGGTKEAHLNITYNYSQHYSRTIGEKGIRTIYGMSGAQSIPILRNAAILLADDVAKNYWTPTEGSAKRALFQLVALAEMRPDGVWNGD